MLFNRVSIVRFRFVSLFASACVFSFLLLASAGCIAYRDSLTYGFAVCVVVVGGGADGVFRRVDFASIPFKEQVEIIRGTNILIGMHGTVRLSFSASFALGF